MTDGDTDAERARPIGRRIVLGSLGVSALGIVFGARAQDALQHALLPITLHDPTGLSDLLPVAGRFRIYSVTGDLPSRSANDYTLQVDGLVDRPSHLSIDDVRHRLPQMTVTRDFQCVTGWRVHGVVWAGVRLRDVLDQAGVQSTATHVVFHSFDGTYTETLSMTQARRDDVLVAHTMEGNALSGEHGGPVRLYVAPMYGYKSLKWLERIEVVDHLPGDGGYWEERAATTSTPGSAPATAAARTPRRDRPIRHADARGALAHHCAHHRAADDRHRAVRRPAVGNDRPARTARPHPRLVRSAAVGATHRWDRAAARRPWAARRRGRPRPVDHGRPTMAAAPQSYDTDGQVQRRTEARGRAVRRTLRDATHDRRVDALEPTVPRRLAHRRNVRARLGLPRLVVLIVGHIRHALREPEMRHACWSGPCPARGPNANVPAGARRQPAFHCRKSSTRSARASGASDSGSTRPSRSIDPRIWRRYSGIRERPRWSSTR